jgi:hypothetical protein
MTPREAAIELEQAIAAAIVRYERAVPGGLCIGIFIDRVSDGFKVKPRLKTRQTPAGLPAKGEAQPELAAKQKAS